MCDECSGSGCKIYDTRPTECRTFECAWLQGELFSQSSPKDTGVMVENFGRFRFVMCDGDEWKQMQDTWNVYIKKGIPVVIGTKTGKTILAPVGVSQTDVILMVQEALHGSNN